MVATARRLLSEAVPWGLVGLIALVAAVERFEVRRDGAWDSHHAASWRYTSRKLKRGVAGAKVVCLGDSLVKHGVQPKLLEKATGLKGYSLALNNGGIPAAYFLLRRTYRRGERPAVVLIDSAELVLSEGPRSSKRKYPWADLLTPWESAELAWTARDPDLFVRVEVDRVLHAFKNRFEIRAAVVTALRGEVDRRRANLPGFARNWSVNAGAQVNPRIEPYAGAGPPPGVELPGTWECDPVNRAYLERTFDLAARHGAAVFWLLPPYHPVNQAYSRFRGEERLFVRFVREVRARHPGVTVVDGRYSGYDGARFFDEAHLNRDGAAAYTAALAGVVTRHLADPSAAPRWVRLPDDRPAPPDPPLEDFVQSVVIARYAAEVMRR